MGLSLLFKGFDYTASYTGDYETGNTYEQMLETGVDSVALTTDSGIDVATSGIIQNYAARAGNDLGTKTGFTETPAGLGNQVRASEKAGQTAIVRPMVDFLDPTVTGVSIGSYVTSEWRQLYKPQNVAAFFDASNPSSYTSYIITQAKAAQAAGAQVFDIGTELDQLVNAGTLGYWTTLIKDVRAVFNGQLTYSASWIDGGTGGSVGAIPVAFWRQLDYVGVDAYVPASNPSSLAGLWSAPPTNAVLSKAFAGQSAIDFLESVADAAGKPLIMTEMGYTDASDAATNPLDQNGTPDQAEQAALYTAFFDAWSAAGTTALVGAYLFNWNPGSFDGGGTSTDFTPQTNPQALAAVKAGFSAPIPTVITLSAGTQTIAGAIADTTGPLEVVVTQYAAGGGAGTAGAGGTVLLTGANSYSGGTLITAGIVGLGSARALGTGGLDILAGELDLDGFNLAVPTLRGGGRIVAKAGKTPAARVFLSVGSGTFTGSLADGGASSALVLIKTGSGILQLSGQSAYTTTLINQGTLMAASASSTGGSAIGFGTYAGRLQITNAALQTSAVTNGLGHVFAGAISNFRVGDTIVLGAFSVSSATSSSAHSIFDLTLTGSGVAGGVVSLQFAAVNGYAAGLGAFDFAVDAHGDTVVTVKSNPLTVGVTVAAFQSDRAMLDKIAGGFTVADTAANITAGLAALAGDAGRIVSITATDRPVVVGLATSPYKATLDKIVGGFGILDTAARVGANIDVMQSDIAHIHSVAFSDPSPPVLEVSQAQSSADAALIAEVTGPYTLEVVGAGGATTTRGHGNGLTIAAAAGGNDTMTGGGSAETFVLPTSFGKDTISDAYTYLASTGHDTISLPKVEFASFAAVLHDATYTSAGTIITATNGDQLTLPKVTAAALQQAEGAFTFA